MSRWPDIVLHLLATRCLYLGDTSDWMSAWPTGRQTLSRRPDINTILGHEMPLQGEAMFDWISAWHIQDDQIPKWPDCSYHSWPWRCLYQGGDMSDWMSAWHIQRDNKCLRWPDVVVHSQPSDASTLKDTYDWMSAWPTEWPNVKMTLHCSILGHQIPLWQATSDWMSAWSKGWPNVKMTWYCTLFEHQMPLLGGYIWMNISLNQRMTKCQDDLTLHYSWPPDGSTGRLHLTECQLDPKDDQISKMTWHSTILVLQLPLLGVDLTGISAWPKGWTNVKMTWYSITLGHEMPLQEEYVWLNISLTHPKKNIKMTSHSTIFGNEMLNEGGISDWMLAWT